MKQWASLFAALLLLLAFGRADAVVSPPVHVPITITGVACPQGSAYADGCAAAVAAPILFPNLLEAGGVQYLAVTSGSGYTAGTYNWAGSGGGCSVEPSGTVTVLAAGSYTNVQTNSGVVPGPVTVVGGTLAGDYTAIGAGGTGATSATGNLGNYTIANPGSGCTSAPTITISGSGWPGAGTGASLAATVYLQRPPWNVPGVDYGVGIPTGTALSDPTTASLPTGCSYATNVVTCSSGTPTINAMDFSLHNGITLHCTGGTLTVTNSKFVVGSNQGNSADIINNSSGCNATIINSEISGNDIPTTNQAGQTINQSGGTLIIKYSYIHDCGEDCIDGTGNPITTQLLYDVVTNYGVNTGHADSLQQYGSNAVNQWVGFNLFYQGIAQPGPGLGEITFQNGTSGNGYTNGQLYNDVIIQVAPSSNGEFTGNFNFGMECDFTGCVSAFIHDLWIDPTGALAFTGIPMFPNGYYSTHGTAQYFPAQMNVANIFDMQKNLLWTTYPNTNAVYPVGSYYVTPDAASYTPPFSDVVQTLAAPNPVVASPASGTVSSGTITFTFTLDEHYTITGSPYLTLNTSPARNATCANGAGNTIVCTYTFTSGDTATNVAITGVSLSGGTIKDAVGNTAVLTPTVDQTFTGLNVGSGTQTVTALTLGAGTTGSFTAPSSSGIAIGTLSATVDTGAAPTNFSLSTSTTYGSPCNAGNSQDNADFTIGGASSNQLFPINGLTAGGGHGAGGTYLVCVQVQ